MPIYKKLIGGQIRVSMTERSDLLENAIAERVNGILKQELLAKSFSSFAEATRQVAQAVSIYNHLRPHLSIDMLTPRRGPRRKRAAKETLEELLFSQQLSLSGHGLREKMQKNETKKEQL